MINSSSGRPEQNLWGDSDSEQSANRTLEFYAEEGYKLRALRQFLEYLDTHGVLQLPLKVLRQFLEDLDAREPRLREPKLRKEKL
jgi:hypothetical protein